MENKIFTISLEKKFKKEEKKIKMAAVKILTVLKKKNVSVEIYLANNRLMKSLNKKLRGKDKIANVLSFEYPKEFIGLEYAEKRGIKSPKPPFGKGTRKKTRNLGEIYLNAEMKDKNFSQEFLLAHGILHLMGYDHMTEKEAEKMEKKEKFIFKKLK